MKDFGRSALLFVAIGLAIYAGVYWWAERLQYANGRSNPLFKIETATRTDYDWLILDASHAMPLDFDDINALMERETGLSIINLASIGSGPLYNRFVLENFLRRHRAKHLLYVVDSFAFRSAEWNEGRFSDAKLLRGTPFKWTIACSFFDYSRHEGVTFAAVLDYVTGFSKINNRERFKRDQWEGEAQFERVYRPSSSMLKKRIDYLYPPLASSDLPFRYLAKFADLIALAQKNGMEVTLMAMPLPAEFRKAQPQEREFSDAIGLLVSDRGLAFQDLAGVVPDARYYFDTDHLNRTGVTEFFEQYLKPVLLSPAAAK